MKTHPEMEELCVLEENQRVCGLITRSDVWESFGGQYGYNLSRKKKVWDIMTKEFLAVDWRMSIEMVSKMAMMRPRKYLYDIVIVLKEDKYYGVVTIKDLLEAAVSIQVERATDANPLTQLPGNKRIQKEIEEKIIKRFHECLEHLYTPEDYHKGEIVSRNRNGLVENFPLDSISAAMITNEDIKDMSIDDFSKKIAKVKKMSKEIKGDSIVEYRVS